MRGAEQAISIPQEVHADLVFRCPDDSMSKSHIYKGDMAFIKTGAINESEIALVRVGEDFMVRRIYWDDCRLYIMPDNYKYGQIILQWENPEKEAQIIGKVVNVLTKAI